MKIILFVLLSTISLVSYSQETALKTGKFLLKAASLGNPVTDTIQIIETTKDAYDWVQAHKDEIGGTVYHIHKRANNAYVDLGGTLYQIKENSDGYYEIIGGTMSEINENSGDLKQDIGGTINQVGINIKHEYKKAKEYGVRVFEYWLE